MRVGLGLASGVVTLGLALGAVAPVAHADPGTYYGQISGVGSTATQDLYNGLSSQMLIAGNRYIASYDATVPAGGSDLIRMRPGGVNIPRPNGSNEGIDALRAAKGSQILTNARGTSQIGGVNTPLNTVDLQFSRSSSQPTYYFDTTGYYSWVPLAVDAVTYATHSTSSLPTNIAVGTSIGESWTTGANAGQLKLTLKNIYGTPGTGPGTTFNVFATDSSAATKVGDQSSAAQIVPPVPKDQQVRSGWVRVMGGDLGFHVRATYDDGVGQRLVDEEDGTLFNVPSLRNRAMIPFSVGSFLGQSRAATLGSTYGVTVTDRRHGAVLRSVDSVPPYTGTLSSGTINSAFPLRRVVFTVVRNSEITQAGTLRSTFGPGGTAYGVTGDAVVQAFGFGLLPNVAPGLAIDGINYVAGETNKRGY